MAKDDTIRIDLKQAAHQLANSNETAAALFENDDVSVVLYVPKDLDHQRPHTRDELYFVISGHGTFRRGTKLVRFSPGDALFVAANVPHRFESFSGDFKAWAVFFGTRRPAAE